MGLCRTLYRFSLHRGGHVRFDDPEDSVHLSQLRGHCPELDELVPSLPWREPMAFEHEELYHISLQEI